MIVFEVNKNNFTVNIFKLCYVMPDFEMPVFFYYVYTSM